MHDVEVFTIDRRGLLYRLARGFHDLRLVIRFAKIGTRVDQVVDVFYVTERDNRGAQNDRRRRSALVRSIRGSASNTRARCRVGRYGCEVRPAALAILCSSAVLLRPEAFSAAMNPSGGRADLRCVQDHIADGQHLTLTAVIFPGLTFEVREMLFRMGGSDIRGETGGARNLTVIRISR